jgi:CBS domain-containing protein
MKKIPAIKTVMTPFPYSVEQKANVEAALAIMDSHTIHHLPVTNDGELAGVISSRDIRRRQEHDADTALTVQDVMSSDTYTVIVRVTVLVLPR